jgi:serine/threonine-protein kinase HipA
LHQEDFCQAFGLPPTRKYQEEGGPSLKSIGELIRKYSAAPAADLLRLARWAIFCAVSGNADGHAKNLSLLYSPIGLRLAPFYDLICTRAYDGLDPRLAISVGGERDPDKLRLKHLHRLALDLGIRPKRVAAEADRIFDDFDEAFDRAKSQLDAAVGFSPAAERVEQAIQKRARAIRKNLKQDRS